MDASCLANTGVNWVLLTTVSSTVIGLLVFLWLVYGRRRIKGFLSICMVMIFGSFWLLSSPLANASIKCPDNQQATAVASPQPSPGTITPTPTAPVIASPAAALTSDNTPTITGTGTDGYTVTVTEEDQVLCTAIVAGGTWSCTPTNPLPDGSHVFKATQKNGNGNTSTTSNNVTFIIDTTAPPAPEILSPSDGATTTDSAPPVNGTGESGATITLTLDGNRTFQIPVITSPAGASTGTWSRFLPEFLSEGAHTLQATQTDAAGNTGPSTTIVNFVVDTISPAVTVNQKVGQADPTTSNSIFFTVTFSEPIDQPSFTASDIILATNPSSPTAMVGAFARLTATTWEFEVTGMANNTTVSATIVADAVNDLAGNTNTASTSTDNSVTYTVPQSTMQSQTTNDNTPILTGQCTPGHSMQLALSGPTTRTYTASCDQNGVQTYTVPDTLPDGTYTMVATDTVGGVASDPSMLTIDTVRPTVTVNQKEGQADPTNVDSASFTIAFSEQINSSSFTPDDLIASSGNVALLQINNTTWEATVTGMTSGTTTTVSLDALKVNDAANNGNTASTSTDNDVTYDAMRPSVTVNQKVGQADPTADNSIFFTVVFSKPIDPTSFSASDIILATNPSSPTATVSTFTNINSTTWEFEVKNMTSGTTVSATVGSGTVTDFAGNTNTASTSTDNSVTYSVPPSTIQSLTTNDNTPTLSGQCTPGHSMQLVISGPTTHTYATICDQNGTQTYDVPDTLPDGSYSMTTTDTTNSTTGSTSTLIIDTVRPSATVDQKVGQADPTNQNSAHFTVIFSEPISPSTFTNDDLTISNGSTTLQQINDTTWEVVVTGMTSGAVTTVSLDALAVTDMADNGNLASTSTDNNVLYDATPPTVTVNQKAEQADPTGVDSASFTVVFDEPVIGLSALDFTVSGTAGTITGFTPINSTTWEITVTGMTAGDTVVVSLPSSQTTDTAGNGNTASTSTDNSVTYQPLQPTTFCEQQTTWTCVPTQGNTYGTHTFQLPARQMYANTGLYLNAGETAQITATGTWSVNERDGIFGGPCRYADVVARINFTYRTADITCVDGTATFTAPSSGILYVSAYNGDDRNDFFGGRTEATGAKTITITSNGQTVPTIPASEAATYDYGSVSSGMIEIWGERTILTVPTTIAQMDAATIKNATDRLDAIYGYHADIQPILPYHGQPIRFAEDSAINSLNAYMVAGNPIRMLPSAINSSDQNERITRAGEPGSYNYAFTHELGHDFTIPGRQWFYMASNTLEVWNNILTCHAFERLGRTPATGENWYHHCLETVAGNSQFNNGQWGHDIALTFFMQFQHQYGWDFYRQVFATVLAVELNADVDDSWKLNYDAMTAAAGTDISSIFQAWDVPMSDSAP